MNTHRLRRVALLGVVGAMVLSLLPSGQAAADITDICEGAPPLAFTDNDSIAAVQAPYVQCLAAYGITSGFPDGRYGPGEPVTRQQMASFIARLATQAQNGNLDIPTTAPAAFTDVDPTNTHYHAINWLAELGITTGVSEGMYDPGGLVTRQAMASFISRAHQTLGVFDEEDIDDIVAAFDGDAFTDIATASSVHRPNIEVLQALGIIGGFTDGTYRPGDPVTRQQMARFLMESAALLDANGLWNGQFIPEEPTDPDEPDTPDVPDTPDPDPDEPEPTNQDFDVVPAYTQVPIGYSLTVTADVGDAEEVSIWLLDADGVFYDGLVVSFLADNDGDFDAPLAQPGIDLTEVDGVAVPPASTRMDVPVGMDGMVEVVIDAVPMNADRFVVLVAETDDPSGPALDDDGEPEVAFGVSPVISVQDVEGIVLVDDATGTPIIDATRPENAPVNVTASLIDEPDPTSLTAEVVEAAGDIEWLLAEVGPGQVCQQTLTLSSVTVAQTLSTGTAPLVDGSASFAVPGGENLDEHCILASWEGVGAYDGEDAEAFDLSGVGLPDHGKITYSDAPPVAAYAEFVEYDVVTAAVNGTASVRVRVVDQYEQPAAGEEVEFTVNEGDTGLPIDEVDYVRVTNAAGIATLSYSANVNRPDRVDAIVLDEMGMDMMIGPGGDIRVLWYVNAAPDESMPTPSPVEAYDADAEWIIVAITDDTENGAANAAGDLLRYSYTSGQVFNDTLGNNVNRLAFGADLDNANTLQILFADDPNTPTLFNILP